MNNPLIPAILDLLRQHQLGIGEYGILKALAEHEELVKIDDGGQLALFRKHFLIMNALYRLQEQLWHEERLNLDISPLINKLSPMSLEQQEQSFEMVDHSPLREYYLHWDNFENTTEEDVRKLLKGFWRHYIKIDSRESALDVLDLELTASMSEITQRYRELAARHHPDRGGEHDAFIRIRHAYETLRNN